jgi:hypothetical protein
MTISWVAPVEAIGKPRMTRRDTWKRRPGVVRYHAWCDTFRMFVPDEAWELIRSGRVVTVSWVAHFVVPKSCSMAEVRRRRGQPHRVKPDRDNIDKAILDCLFEQDSVIAAGSLLKTWSLVDEPQISMAISDELLP